MAVEEFDDVGKAVHDWTVERREAYLASWSGVRVFGGAGWELAVGWMKGVEFEPSTVVVESAGGFWSSFMRPLASFTCPTSSCTKVSCSIAYVIPGLYIWCKACSRSSQPVLS